MSAVVNELSVYKIDNPYQFYVDHTIRTVLNTQELALYHLINTSYASCFFSAKQNNQDLAIGHLHQGNLLLKKANPNVITMVSVFCMPYISYYYYKIRNYEMALSESERIIDKALSLEQTDHEYLFFCRIQQVQNLGRIHWANNDTRQSIKLYAKCILDIYTKSTCWITTQVINNVPVRVLAENTQYHFFIQIITEILNRIIQKYLKEKSLTLCWLELFFEPLSSLDFDDLNSKDPAYQSFRDCISIFKLLIAGNQDGFKASANVFLDNSLYDQEMKKVICRYLYYFNFI